MVPYCIPYRFPNSFLDLWKVLSLFLSVYSADEKAVRQGPLLVPSVHQKFLCIAYEEFRPIPDLSAWSASTIHDLLLPQASAAVFHNRFPKQNDFHQVLLTKSAHHRRRYTIHLYADQCFPRSGVPPEYSNAPISLLVRVSGSRPVQKVLPYRLPELGLVHVFRH